MASSLTLGENDVESPYSGESLSRGATFSWLTLMRSQVLFFACDVWKSIISPNEEKFLV